MEKEANLYPIPLKSSRSEKYLCDPVLYGILENRNMIIWSLNGLNTFFQVNTWQSQSPCERNKALLMGSQNPRQFPEQRTKSALTTDSLLLSEQRNTYFRHEVCRSTDPSSARLE
jgi:hypothetical protein